MTEKPSKEEEERFRKTVKAMLKQSPKPHEEMKKKPRGAADGDKPK